VDTETIADIESGKRRGVRALTLEKLAETLSTTWDQLLSDQERARRVRSIVRLAHDLEPESSLDLLALADADKPAPKLETRFGLLEAFGPAEIVHTISAPRVREGDRRCPERC